MRVTSPLFFRRFTPLGDVMGRSASDAPDIDGLVYIKNGHGLKVGEFASVRVTHSDAHDLWAEQV